MDENYQPRLRLRGTFIDTDDREAELTAKRAHSEPRSSVSKAESDHIFETEQRYVERLDQHHRTDVAEGPSSSSKRRGNSRERGSPSRETPACQRECTPERFLEPADIQQDRPVAFRSADSTSTGHSSTKTQVAKRREGADPSAAFSLSTAEPDDCYWDCYETTPSGQQGHPSASGAPRINPERLPGHGQPPYFPDGHCSNEDRCNFRVDQLQQVRRPGSHVSCGTPTSDDAFSEVSCTSGLHSNSGVHSRDFSGRAGMVMPQQMGQVNSPAAAQQLQIFTALQLGQQTQQPGRGQQLPAQQQGWGPAIPMPTRSSISEPGVDLRRNPATAPGVAEAPPGDFGGQRPVHSYGHGSFQEQQPRHAVPPRGPDFSERKQSSVVSGASNGSRGSRTSRTSNIVPALEEIPRRIGNELQRVADYIMESMQSEVNHIVDVIQMQHPNGTGCSRATKVVEHLKGIPTMGKSFLEARVEKTKATVRFRIGSMVSELTEMHERLRIGDAGSRVPQLEKACSNCGNLFAPEAAFCLLCGTRRVNEKVAPEEDKEAIVHQMRRIQTEVEQMAGEAVQAAAKECLEHQTRQIDYALASLPRADREALKKLGLPSSNPLKDHKPKELGAKEIKPREGIVPAADFSMSRNQAQSQPSQSSKPQVSQSAGSTSRDSAGNYQRSQNSSQTLQNISERRQTMMSQESQELNEMHERLRIGGMVQNQTTIQEARSRSAVSAPPGCALDGADSQTMPNGQRMNPGSIGHPDVCLRPCLYFAAGRCSNGVECTFCHMPHPKRPARLDKRHREMLKRMPFFELLHLCLPLLKQKALDTGSPEVKAGLDRLAECAMARAGKQGFESHAFDLNDLVEEARPLSQVGVDRDGADSQVSRSEVSVGGSRRKCGFQGALQVMGARMILTMLSRMPAPEAVEEKQIIDQVLTSLHDMPPEDSRDEMQEYNDGASEFSGVASNVGSNVGSNIGSQFSGSPAHAQRQSFGRQGSDAGRQGGDAGSQRQMQEVGRIYSRNPRG